MDIQAMARTARKVVIDNSPTILTATAVAGTLSTGILAAKGGMKAGRELALRDQETRDAEFTKREQFMDDVKHTWRFYIPAGLAGVSTIAAVITGHTISSRRNAALLSLYTLSETAFTEYKQKIVETLGENKEQKVRDAIVQDQINHNPPPDREGIVGTGEVLCKDGISGRYFMSSVEDIKQAMNNLNYDILNNDGSASLNSFYEAIGLEKTSMGEEVGWNLDKLLDLAFTTALSPDGRPCVVIGYTVFPTRDYWHTY